MKYSEEHGKKWKMRNSHCKIWNMARKWKIMENKKHIMQEVKYGEDN